MIGSSPVTDWAARRSLPEALRRGLTFWRRSIQARVVVSTVLLSTVVLVAVGWFLLRQVQQGLLDHRVDTVVREVATENQAANDRLAAFPGTETDASAQAHDLFSSIFSSGQARGFSVVMAGPGSHNSSLEERGTELTPQLDLASVPQSLVDHFDGSTQTAWTYTTITFRSRGQVTSSTPGIVVGTLTHPLADGSTRTVYYLFPLDDVQQTLALVTRALLTAGILLLLLTAS